MPCKHCHKPKVKRDIFVQGGYYKNSFGTYICARTHFDSSKKDKFTLVNLKSGGRWTQPQTLGQLNRIEKEFVRIK